MTVPQGAGRKVLERTGAYVGAAAAKRSHAADLPAGLVSLKFIGTALRRRAWLWCAIAMAGLLIGIGMYVALPLAYQASATILLTQMPGGSTGPLPIGKPPDAMQDNVVMMQSRAVAERAMRDLGLRQTVDSFIAAETVTPVTDRALTLTVSAPSSGEAVRRANALAAEFLKFRAEQLQAQQKLMLISLSQQLSQAQKHVVSLSRQIASVSAQTKSPSQEAELKSLETQHILAVSVLTGLQQAIPDFQVTKTAAVEASGILDPAAPIARAPGPLGKGARIPIRYAVTGLIAGLALGLGLAIVLELVSDRPRRREDIARALGGPVTLSVGSVPAGRRAGLASAGGDDVQRIVAHLRDNLPGSSRGAAAALAVVAVDNAQVAALPLVSLAVSCAREGRQVLMADLSSGAHAARLLGAGDPGVRAVSADGADLVVAVPDRDDVVPAGPVHRASPLAQPEPGAAALAAAFASADLLLTLVTLDPSLGAEHLATWAANAVVVVTAGRSSWERLRGVGEMIRLAGTRLVCAVLIGTDSTDESLGATPGSGETSTVLVRAHSTDESLGATQTPNPSAPDNQGLLLAGSPAPAHHSSASRPGRGLRPGVTGKRI